MTWLRLDDRFALHPKISALSDGAFRLHVSGLLYCSGQETDGRIPAELVQTLMPTYRPRYLPELAARGLWTPTAEVIEVHDFTDYNPTREQLQRRRAVQAERVRRWRDRHADDPA